LRLATPADVALIADKMWARGREELREMRIDPKTWWAGWMNRIALGNAVAYRVGDSVQAILGWDEEAPGVVTTSFQAVEGWNGKAVTKEMRRTIPMLMKGRGVYLFNTYSLCVDPDSPKWFRLLGMTEDREFQGFRPTLRRFFRRA
jgi:hypothetical protein